ncbi:MAG: ABC transporter permease [Acidimicrobiales bacterium]
MTRRAFRFASYRFRATLRRRRGGYLTVLLLVALVGGVALAAVAGARRTQSAFPAYLAATDASELQVQIYPLTQNGAAWQRNLSEQLARLPYVERVASAPYLLVLPIGRNGKALPTAFYDNDVEALGSDGGMYFRQDRVSVAAGRMADPSSADEMVATAAAVQLSGWHLGETVAFGAYSLQQADSPTFNPLTDNPAEHFSVKLVGLVVLSSQVVHDDVDRYPTEVLMTPALSERLQASQTFPLYGLRLEDGSRYVAAVEREIIAFLPPGTTYKFHVTSVVIGQVERASKPEVTALGVFGAIAALAALLIAGLAISRGLWAEREDFDVLRALGAEPALVRVDATLGLLGAVVLGSIAAVGVAVALSPLTPIGPVRQVDPSPGFAFDWTVMAIGFGGLVTLLGGLAVALAHRRATRYGERDEPVQRASSVVNAATRAGLPAPAIAGLRFALERGRRRAAVPVRAVLVGAALAVAVVVATVTFGSGLSTLNSHPALYGWNWSYAITSPGSENDVPPVVGHLLDHDPYVAAWTGFNFANAQIDGQTVPVMLGSPRATIGPPILSGHSLEATNQIVLGSATLAALHKRIGDTVVVSYGTPKDAPIYVPPTDLLIVGSATMPAIGSTGTLHPSMGTGALISTGITPPAFQRVLTHPDPNLNGPDIEVVRLRPGLKPGAGLASLQRIAEAANKVMAADPNTEGDIYVVLGVQRPAEIVNYQSTGATPAILASGLAAGAVVALGLTLVASVRRRRRELALLKTLGFTQRQLAAAVAWQASVAAMIGAAVGVPVGIALGRWLWILFAREIYAIPEPSVPVLEVVVIVLGTLVLANLVAAIPGRIAARTPTALVLRAE